MADKVLIVDDDVDCLQLTGELLLEWDYRVITAASGAVAVEKAKRELPDLILMDVHLGDMTGPDVCQELRQHFATRFIPIIMLTVEDQVRRKIEGLAKGADDYVMKTIDPEELKARVETLIRRTSEQANVNPLTKLPGNLVIEQLVRERLENGVTFSVCYCDLDNFKAYNDRYGYAAGDRVLLHTSQLIVQTVNKMGGEQDFVGHIGGDDFVFVTTPDREAELSHAIMAIFDASIAQFYAEEDRQNQGITLESHSGEPKRYPLMTITIAAVNNDEKKFESHRILAERAAEIKRYLKQSEGSNFLSDRRGPEEKRHSKAPMVS